MNELKQLAEILEKKAKEEKEIGIRIGLMQAAFIAWEQVNKLQSEMLCK